MIEYACGIPQIMKGEYLPRCGAWHRRLFDAPAGSASGGASTPVQLPGDDPDVDVRYGLRGGAMPLSLKPPERDPSVPVRLAELFLEAGAPEGLLQVVHGDKEMVDAILDHPDIAAISFVGSSDIAQYIYARGTANNKRVQGLRRRQEPRGSCCLMPTMDQVALSLSLTILELI